MKCPLAIFVEWEDINKTCHDECMFWIGEKEECSIRYIDDQFRDLQSAANDILNVAKDIRQILTEIRDAP